MLFKRFRKLLLGGVQIVQFHQLLLVQISDILLTGVPLRQISIFRKDLIEKFLNVGTHFHHLDLLQFIVILDIDLNLRLSFIEIGLKLRRGKNFAFIHDIFLESFSNVRIGDVLFVNFRQLFGLHGHHLETITPLVVQFSLRARLEIFDHPRLPLPLESLGERDKQALRNHGLHQKLHIFILLLPQKTKQVSIFLLSYLVLDDVLAL